MSASLVRRYTQAPLRLIIATNTVININARVRRATCGWCVDVFQVLGIKWPVFHFGILRCFAKQLQKRGIKEEESNNKLQRYYPQKGPFRPLKWHEGRRIFFFETKHILRTRKFIGCVFGAHSNERSSSRLDNKLLRLQLKLCNPWSCRRRVAPFLTRQVCQTAPRNTYICTYIQ